MWKSISVAEVQRCIAWKLENSSGFHDVHFGDCRCTAYLLEVYEGPTDYMNRMCIAGMLEMKNGQP